MPIVTLDADDRLRLPSEVREALDLQPGDSVFLTVVDGELHVKKAVGSYVEYGPVAHRVRAAYAEHPERFLTEAQVMEELGITQADLDALDETADEDEGAG